MKQVLDPEAPVSAYKVDTETRRVLQQGVPPVLSPFDENALEAALRIKETQKSRITVLTAGRNLSATLARKTLATGADQVVLIEDSTFEDLDNHATAFILAAAIGKVGKYDLILTGRQAADTNAGFVGSGIAEVLNIPVITIARNVEPFNDGVRVERVLAEGYEVIEAPVPALITVSNEAGELRSVSIKEMLASKKRQVKTWKASRLDIQSSNIIRPRLVDIYIPQSDVKCELITGITEEESGENMAVKLKETGIVR